MHVGESVVVRVGDTVRRPVGPHTPAVHALLHHFESVGFDGAPRVLGIDEQGREILTFLEGTAALAPVPGSDELVAELGAFLRAMHAAQAGFRPDEHAPWQRMVGAPAAGEVICHNDLFWPNVVVDGERLVGLIDWDLAAPAPRLHDLASAANFWVALRPDDQCEAWGIPTETARRAPARPLRRLRSRPREPRRVPGGDRAEDGDRAGDLPALGARRAPARLGRHLGP